MKTIAISGGKGGVGKTCITVNLGIALAAQGKRVVVFDADLQLANLDVMLGIRPEFNLFDVVSNNKSLREIQHPCQGNIRAITGGSAIPALMTAGPKRMGTFFGQIGELADHTDILLFDLAAGLDNRTISFLTYAQHAILVVTPDPSSVTDAYATLKVASKRAPATDLSLVVNMTSGPREATRIHHTVNSTAKTYLGKQIRSLGHIHLNHDIAHSVRRRQPFMCGTPGTKPVKEMEALATSLLQTLSRPVLNAA